MTHKKPVKVNGYFLKRNAHYHNMIKISILTIQGCHMINVIKMLCISLLMSIALIGVCEAETILYGTVKADPSLGKGYYFNDYYDETCKKFPLTRHEFNLYGYDLKYDDNVPLQDRVKDLNLFSLPISANLTLISSNTNTGIYKFKLKLEGGDWLNYEGSVRFFSVEFETGGRPLRGNGSLKLADGEEPEFIIEGQLETINGKSRWISFNRNKYFDIEVETSYNCKTSVELKLLHDFPVIVSK